MSESKARTINPNEADAETLSGLPGIGPVMAQRIIEARPYGRAADLTKVQGIGPSTVARLQPHLTFNGSDGQSDEALDEGAGIMEAKAPEVAETYEVPLSPEQAAREPFEALEMAEEVSEAPPRAFEEVSELEAPMEPALLPSEEPEAAEAPVGSQIALGAGAEGGEEAVEMEGGEEAVEAEGGEEAAQLEGGEEAVEAEEGEPGEAVLAEVTEKPQPARRSWVLWTVAGSALLVLLLSLGLNLAILSSINGGRLQFASPAEVGEVRVRVDGLDARAADLGQEVQGLRARLDNVEAFGGRIDTLEGSTQQLGAELEDTAREVQGLSTEVTGLGQELSSLSQDLATLDKEIAGVQSEVQTLQEQTARTESFFGGLRALLDELLMPEGGAK